VRTGVRRDGRSMKSAERASLRSLLVLAALAAVVFLAALLIGSSGIGVRRALEALGGSGDAATRSVLLGVRLPRVLAAFGVGSLLALSGVLLQALFRNPLADPYVLGVSGGAAVGALLAMIAGAAALLVQSAAVAGALAAVGTVYALARGGGTPRLLLTGVVLASACGALVSVLLALADTSRVRGMVFWLAGDLEWAVSPALSAGAAALAVAVAVDRKSTRLNSSHVEISYAVFCLKKKKLRFEDDVTSRTDLQRVRLERKEVNHGLFLHRSPQYISDL